MFARGRSTRGQMRSPSIAQRGEGGVRGGSGELTPTAQGEPGTERDACEDSGLGLPANYNAENTGVKSRTISP